MFDKICHVNLPKLRATNPKLLRIAGVPCQIYLDCFSPHEFVKLTNLITAYGGVVLPPDDETVVLVKDAESASRHYPRFSVNWLHDTVSKDKLQDIGKYLIPVSPDTVPPRSVKYFPITGAPTVSVANASTKASSAQPPSSADGAPVTPKRQSQWSTAEDEQDAAESADVPTKKRRSKMKPRSIFVDEFGDRTANGESDGGGGADGDSFASKTTLTSAPRWSEAGAGTKEKKVERKKSISCLAELKNEVDEVRRAERRTGKKYSDAENHEIMQFLIDKNKISEANRRQTWKEMEAKQILHDPPRSANGMHQHFNRTFINCYKKYTNDPAVIEQFEKLERKKLKTIVNYFNIGHSTI